MNEIENINVPCCLLSHLLLNPTLIYIDYPLTSGLPLTKLPRKITVNYMRNIQQCVSSVIGSVLIHNVALIPFCSSCKHLCQRF